jgi:hypothetical protein
MMTEHRKALLMNRIRYALDALQREGVGYIDLEETDKIHYMIDGKVFVVEVKDGDTNGSV